MTLTPIRPVADALFPEQQRLEVELLLGEPVLRPQDLERADHRLMADDQPIRVERWRELGCLPLQQNGQALQVAIPTHWGPASQQSLAEELTDAGLTASFNLALASDLSERLENLETTPVPGDAPSATAVSSVRGIDDSDTDDFHLDDDNEEDNEGNGHEDHVAYTIQPRSLIEDLAISTGGSELREVTDDLQELEISSESANASPIVSLVDRILIEALSAGASDIHIEPQEHALEVRFRQDGVLQKHFEDLPKSLIPAVTSRFKIMADLDIAERRMPQDGRIRRTFRGRKMDFRVSTLPTRLGEKVVLRLLDSGATQLGLDTLITDPQAREVVRNLGSKPFGMILVTGPTGSGKSTTLYSLLAERNNPTINISTVEDPIEYTLKGITQTQVNRDKGLDFSVALRAFMRQDPDVLLVGETRDLETAKTAIEAALTGHLVLTTLHCNDAPSAIARLDEMGVEPFLVSASLLGIVSQRLLRRVCVHCRQSYRPTPEELGRFGLLAGRETNVTFFRANKQPPGGPHACPICQGSGYKGRVGVYEVLRINEEIAAAIAKRATTDVLRRLALESGMKTLLGYGLDLVRNGDTTLEEVERMLLTDTGLESERRARMLSTLTCAGCGAGLREEWLECPYCLQSR
ncbi:GspE/PulE family protein [Synechococcus sp. CCY9202]|uniref:GspE/PulE family protein n=1 Tax=Synechococcus sp. CCY9202 TaxID=174698 RepID=UPI002B1ED676|nr:GspE/PulE family protein [Synechococcus sp. CCY9202]MEA5423486.1 GspE/PulE family protein [Synechococcus sp. CCY9202]